MSDVDPELEQLRNDLAHEERWWTDHKHLGSPAAEREHLRIVDEFRRQIRARERARNKERQRRRMN